MRSGVTTQQFWDKIKNSEKQGFLVVSKLGVKSKE
jgi:hypothetical protein